MKLSAYFDLSELIASQTADRLGINNEPSPFILANLNILALQLDKVRLYLGRPIHISSGYRSPELNAAIGGAKTSTHLTGLAADFKCPGFGNTMTVFNKLANSGLNFDQLIAEYPASKTGGWIHIGYGEAMRRQCLIYDGKTYKEIKV
jgi:zinc D-Ala-D-Ala carboxypeptidase